MDQFMGFIPTADKNTVTTNYTGDRGVSILIRDEEYRHGSFLDIVVCTESRNVSVLFTGSFHFKFADGIMFPDVIEVNFSLTVDPYSRRKPEFNDDLKSTIMVYAIGNTSMFGNGIGDTFPSNLTKENPISLGR